jgi:SM-20-related protein
MLLDLDAIANTKMKSDPFEWGFIPTVFRTFTIASDLSNTFPDDGFERYTRHSTAKQYNTYVRSLIKMGHGLIHEPDSQPPLWKQLAEELLSTEYAQSVEKATGVNLEGTHMEAVYWRLPEGSVIDPHLDNPLKRISHLFYFNEFWNPDDGGCLRLLNSWKIEDYAYEFPPILNTSLLIVRSGKSWHGYKPVKGSQVRKAVQISFCECAAV